MLDPDEYALRRVGQVIGNRWTLERLLGTGGMAAVYAARNSVGELAALKLLHPEMSVMSEARERFLREGKAANAIEHPGVVRVLEEGTAGDTAYLVMELLEGETLSDRLDRQGTLPPDELLGYLDQVLDVLVAAHGLGIIHRDLKPDNLFVTRDGRVKVLDYGIARVMDSMAGDFKTRTGMALGTLPYMAPEQALGRRGQIDGRTDLFALGATAFRILVGRKVHEADTEAELLMAMASKPVPSLRSVAPNVPAAVAAIIDTALAFTQDARYPDARTMQADVRTVRRGGEPSHAVRRRGAREGATRIEARGATAVAHLPAEATRIAPAVVPTSPSSIAVATTNPQLSVHAASGALDPTQPLASAATTVSGGVAADPGSAPTAVSGAIQEPPEASPSTKPPAVAVALLGGAAVLLVLGLATGAVLLGFGRSTSTDTIVAEPGSITLDASDPNSRNDASEERSGLRRPPRPKSTRVQTSNAKESDNTSTRKQTGAGTGVAGTDAEEQLASEPAAGSEEEARLTAPQPGKKDDPDKQDDSRKTETRGKKDDSRRTDSRGKKEDRSKKDDRKH